MAIILPIYFTQSLKNLFLFARIQLFFHLKLPLFMFYLLLKDQLILERWRPSFELSLQLFDLKVVAKNLFLYRTHLYGHFRLKSVYRIL